MDSIGARGTAAAAAEPLARPSACAAAWHSCACTPLARTRASRGLNGTKAIGRRAAQHRINEFKRHATHNAGARVRNARRIWQLLWTPHPRSRPAPRIASCSYAHAHEFEPREWQARTFARALALSTARAASAATFSAACICKQYLHTVKRGRVGMRYLGSREGRITCTDRSGQPIRCRSVSVDGRARCCDGTLGRRKC